MRTREEWDAWYSTRDPWKYEGTDEDRLRVQALLARLGGRRFSRGLDLGCGEGWLTHAISSVCARVTGYDIAEPAVRRAQERFPHIDFRQGELLDVCRDPSVRAEPWDLVVAAEVLYYLQTDEERIAALDAIAALGVDDCLYYFTVIVTGGGGARRYFTHDSFLSMLAKRFEVTGIVPLAAHIARPVDRAIRLIPFRGARLRMRDRVVGRSDPSRWKHVGYVARRRRDVPG